VHLKIVNVTQDDNELLTTLVSPSAKDHRSLIVLLK